jgi:hypothetical protein
LRAHAIARYGCAVLRVASASFAASSIRSLVVLTITVALLGTACGKRRNDDASRARAPVGPTSEVDAGRPHREVVNALLDKGNVDIYLDPRKRDVIVPLKYKFDSRLILKVGRSMPIPIPDLRVTDDRVSGTLSFDQEPFFCSVPWSAVFAAVGEDGRGWVWNDRIPSELQDASAPRIAPSQ